jgi:hypothetical protein
MLLAVGFLAGCMTSSPQAVGNLQVAADNDNLVITWSNPTDYEAVNIQVTDPDGQRIDSKRVFGYATQTGPARAVVLDVKPGTYTVRVVAAVKQAQGDTRRESKEVTCRVPEPVSGGYVTRQDLALDDKAPLDIVFLIHPGSSYAGGGKTVKPIVRLFRQMTAGVLSEAFNSAIQLPDEVTLKRIEDYRDQVSTDLERATWPLDPDALIIVDVRAPSDRIPGQLAIRVLDLKLAEVLGKGPDRLDRELYNRRPLVIEEYQQLGDLPEEKDLRAALRIFRDAWRGLLGQALDQPRYRYYVDRLTAYKRDRKPAVIRDKDALRAFMFNAVPEAMRPFDEKQDDADKAATVFKERALAIERELLFGPGIGGPLVKPPVKKPARKEAPAPAEKKEPAPAKKEEPNSTKEPAPGTGEGASASKTTAAEKEPKK